MTVVPISWSQLLVTSLGGRQWEALGQHTGSLMLQFFATVQKIGPVVTVLAAPAAPKPHSGCP